MADQNVGLGSFSLPPPISNTKVKTVYSAMKKFLIKSTLIATISNKRFLSELYCLTGLSILIVYAVIIHSPHSITHKNEKEPS